jgi:phage-related tail protein
MPRPTVFSLLYKQLVKWFLRTVWPWFIENIWPEIQKHILDIFGHAARSAKDAACEWINKRKRAQEEGAQRKAAEAEQRAKDAHSESEADKHRAVAQVWREVAEQLRQENEDLKAKLDEILKQSMSDVSNEITAMELKDIIEEGDDSSLKLKGSETVLRLPEPTDKAQK